MNKKELIKNLKFCTDLINIFNIYSECVDDYFKDENNRKEHKELYNYYNQLIFNIQNLKNGVKLK